MDGVDFGSAPLGLGGFVLAADLAFGAARAALDLTLGLSLSCLALALASVFAGFAGFVAFVGGGPAGDVEEADEDSDFLVTAFFAIVFFTGMALVAFGLGRADGELEEEGGGFFFTGFF